MNIVASIPSGSLAAGFGAGLAFRIGTSGYGGTLAARIVTERLATDGDNDIIISGSGTGAVSINDAYKLPNTVTSVNGYVLTANTDGSTAWSASGGGGVTFPLEGTVGSVTAPTYSFSTATNTGMYHSTGLVGLSLAVTGTEVLQIQKTGTATEFRVGGGNGEARITSQGFHNLVLQTNDGASSGTIIIESGVNGQISINPDGTGKVKLDGIEIDNSLISTGFVLKATSATEAGWAAESGSSSSSVSFLIPEIQNNTSGYLTTYNHYPVMNSAPFYMGNVTSLQNSGRYNTSPFMKPFIQTETGTWGGIGMHVYSASATANSIRVGIYNSSSIGNPTSMVGYCDLSTAATGAVTQTATYDPSGTVASLSLTTNTQYWMAVVSLDGVTHTLISQGEDGEGQSSFPQSSPISASGGGIGYTCNFSTNVLETNNPPRMIGIGLTPFPAFSVVM